MPEHHDSSLKSRRDAVDAVLRLWMPKCYHYRLTLSAPFPRSTAERIDSTAEFESLDDARKAAAAHVQKRKCEVFISAFNPTFEAICTKVASRALTLDRVRTTFKHVHQDVPESRQQERDFALGYVALVEARLETSFNEFGRKWMPWCLMRPNAPYSAEFPGVAEVWHNRPAERPQSNVLLTLLVLGGLLWFGFCLVQLQKPHRDSYESNPLSDPDLYREGPWPH